MQAVTAATAKNDGIMTPAIAHNVTGNTTDLGYTVLPHTDMDSLYDLQTASSASCFNVTPTGNLTAVDTCHLTKKQICCIGTTDLRGNVVSNLL